MTVRRWLLLSLTACGPTIPGEESDAETQASTQDVASDTAGSSDVAGTDTAGESEVGSTASPDQPSETCMDYGCPPSYFCNPVSGDCELDCMFVEQVVRPAAPPVMLVVDIAGSMAVQTWDHDGDVSSPDVTRWSTVRDELDAMLLAYEDRVDFGLQQFPSPDACPNGPGNCYNAGACVIAGVPEIDTGPTAGAAIQSELPAAAAVDLDGAKPMRAAIENSVASLEPLQSTLAPPAMVVITDGAAACSATGATPDELLETYDAEVEGVVSDAFDTMNIPTYVVGVDIADDPLGGSNPFDAAPAINPQDAMNALADAGGRAGADPRRFFDAHDEATLRASLDAIARDTISCVIDLSAPPNTPPQSMFHHFVEFAQGSPLQEIPYLDPPPTPEECAASTQAGWIWLEEATVVMFCGPACAELQSSGSVETVYGCPPPW